MAVVSHKARLLYVVVPKAACTSVKRLFLELDGGSLEAPPLGFLDRLRGKTPLGPRSVHQIEGYITRPFSEVGAVPEGYARITVVRDPLARLHSAWTNKADTATFARRGELERLTAAGLSTAPSFGAFLDDFERYRDISSPVNVHTRPMRWHLGDEPGWYDKVFRMEEMAEFEAWVGARAGSPVRLTRDNRSAGEARPLGFEPHHADVARRLLADDYALLAGCYDFDESLAAFRRRHGLAGTGAEALAQ